MKTLTDQLSQYAAYHRHPRNIVTHFIGIPLIVLAVVVLLSRPVFTIFDIALTPAILAVIATLIFYFLLDLGFGFIMTALLVLSLLFGNWAASQSTSIWLLIGIGGFLVGWIIQFIGHYYEGKKPAFVDDIIGLLIGPLFVLAEALFILGIRKDLQSAIEARAGGIRK